MLIIDLRFITMLLFFAASSHSFLSAASTDCGRESFNFGGNLRFRFEELENYRIKGYGGGSHDGFLLWRLRLNFDYRFQDGGRVHLQLQDNRYNGSELSVEDFPRSCPYENQLSMRQLYHEGSFDNDLGFRLGRQAISFGDNRIFGPGNWGNTGRYTWDALKFGKKLGAYELSFFAAKRVEYDPKSRDNSHFPYWVYALYASKKEKARRRDYFYIQKLDDSGDILGESGPGNLRRHTLGFQWSETRGPWCFAATGALQFGEEGADRVSANAFHVAASRALDRASRFRLGLDYARASGDGDPNDGKAETFDGVFGAVDKYYGRMNLVSWMNLSDLQLSIKHRASKVLRVGLAFHWLHLEDPHDAWYFCTGKVVSLDRSGNSGDYIGREVDLIFDYSLSKAVSLKAGIAHFTAGSFYDRGDADWTFLQCSWKF